MKGIIGYENPKMINQRNQKIRHGSVVWIYDRWGYWKAR
jgi:ribosome-associated protein YbcJ (S4-like RNA binding protein)